MPVEMAASDLSSTIETTRRFTLKNAMIVDGTGAPAYGLANIVIEDGLIAAIELPGSAIAGIAKPDGGEAGGDRSGDTVIDLAGAYVLPGFVDAHAHIGYDQQISTDEYVFKLWLGHGITTVREAGSFWNGLDFTVTELERSERHEIVAPHLVPYVEFGQGFKGGLKNEDDVAEWVEDVVARGAKGIKFLGARPDLFKVAIEEAKKHGIGTMSHHAQSQVARVNARTTAQWGLDSIEHSYGLPEAMFSKRLTQDYAPDFNDEDERARFTQLGRVWAQSATPGSKRWVEFVDELVQLGTTLVPTFVAYSASRDVEHAKGRRYHSEFTSPRMSRFFAPTSHTHGSYFANWGTEEEAAWRENYRLWMRFVRDFHLAGGRVCAGSDAGFIYNLYGFGFIEELELLREAGFAPLEIIRSATLSGAELLKIDHFTGSVEVGKVADILVASENPLANFKTLNGNGHLQYIDGVPTDVGGVRYTIKSGVVYDAPRLIQDVREMVAAEKATETVDQESTVEKI